MTTPATPETPTPPKYEMDKEVHDELTGLLEDAVTYFCDEHQVSGELAWVIAQCFSTAKVEQFKGNVD